MRKKVQRSSQQRNRKKTKTKTQLSGRKVRNNKCRPRKTRATASKKIRQWAGCLWFRWTIEKTIDQACSESTELFSLTGICRARTAFGQVTDKIRFVRVPSALGLDVDESPERDTCSGRDRVRERHGRQNVCAVGYKFRPGNPLCSLACVTSTNEGICDGVALAQIAVVRTAWPRIRVSRRQGINGERAPVACRQHVRCDRARILANSVECPCPRRATSRSNNPSNRKARKVEQGGE